ncbi:hypothetical protein AAF712_010353 [Marasmius tenuissimus]|uniref:Uncharacterized protein n=1 Tax=Marasmius tenuissimus TaxID=585030 RepID=A0ABR2ZNE8_9AGAR
MFGGLRLPGFSRTTSAHGEGATSSRSEANMEIDVDANAPLASGSSASASAPSPIPRLNRRLREADTAADSSLESSSAGPRKRAHDGVRLPEEAVGEDDRGMKFRRLPDTKTRKALEDAQEKLNELASLQEKLGEWTVDELIAAWGDAEADLEVANKTVKEKELELLKQDSLVNSLTGTLDLQKQHLEQRNENELKGLKEEMERREADLRQEKKRLEEWEANLKEMVLHISFDRLHVLNIAQMPLDEGGGAQSGGEEPSRSAETLQQQLIEAEVRTSEDGRIGHTDQRLQAKVVKLERDLHTAQASARQTESELEQQITDLQSTDSVRTEIDALVNEISGLKNDYQISQNDRNKLQQENTEYKTRLETAANGSGPGERLVEGKTELQRAFEAEQRKTRQLESDNNLTNQKLTKAQNDANGLTEELRRTQEDLSTARRGQTASEQLAKEVQAKLSEAQGEKTVSERSAKDLEEKLRRTREDLSTAQREKTESERLAKEAQERLSKAQGEKTANEQSVKDLEEKLRRTREDLSTAQREKTESERLAKEAQERLSKAQGEKTASEQSVKDLEEKLRRTREDLSTAQRESNKINQSAQNKEKQLQDEINTLETKKNELEAENLHLPTLRDDLAQLKSNLTDWQSRCSDLTHENEKLKRSALISPNTVSSSEARIESLQKSLSEMLQKVKDAEATGSQAKRDLGELRRTHDLLQVQKSAGDGTISTLKEQLDSRDQRINQLEEEAKVGGPLHALRPPSLSPVLSSALRPDSDASLNLRRAITRGSIIHKALEPSSAPEITHLQEELKKARTELQDLKEAMATMKGKGKATDEPNPGSAPVGEVDQVAKLYLAAKNLPERLSPEAVKQELAMAKAKKLNWKLKATTTPSQPQPQPQASSSSTTQAPQPDSDDDESDESDDADDERNDGDDEGEANSSGSEGEDDDMWLAGPESNESRKHAQYKQKTKGSVSKKKPAHRRSKLVRQVLSEALPTQHRRLLEVFARPGVSTQRLAQFEANPSEHGPKIRCTWLDKAGHTTTKMLRKSKWNLALIYRLTQLLVQIVKDCPDRRRFGKGWRNIDWKAQLQKRFNTIYSEIIDALPKNDAEKLDPNFIAMRLIKKNLDRNISNGRVNLRRAKQIARLSVIYKMLAVSKARKDEDGQAFWDYARETTAALDYDGMSDEEAVTEEVTTQAGVKTTMTFMNVLVLVWRHPHFRALFIIIDQAPELEDAMFKQTRLHYKLPRRRVEKESTRKSIPKGLARSYFKDGYLDGLMEFELADLKLSKRDFKIREFELPRGE